MPPTLRAVMLSPQSRHPDGEPRKLTPGEEARIAHALRDDPPVFPRRPKLAAVPEHKPTPRQPWQLAA